MLRNKLRALLLSQIKNRIYLYNQGDTCDSITGGWTAITKARFDADSMVIQHDKYGFRFTTNKPVSLENKLLCIQVQRIDKYTNTNYYLAFDISTSDDLVDSKRYTVINGGNKSLTVKKINMDSGEKYIRLVSYYGIYRIDKIWLEDKESV